MEKNLPSRNRRQAIGRGPRRAFDMSLWAGTVRRDKLLAAMSLWFEISFASPSELSVIHPSALGGIPHANAALSG